MSRSIGLHITLIENWAGTMSVSKLRRLSLAGWFAYSMSEHAESALYHWGPATKVSDEVLSQEVC